MTEYIRVIRQETALDRHRAQLAAEFARARGDAPQNLDDHDDVE